MIALLLAAAPALSWQGTAEVYPPSGPLKIAVRTKIDRSGDVVSESWPVAIGEAKGMHRMTLTGTGGTMEVGGKQETMPAATLAEERAQFGFYLQLQKAAARARSIATTGANAFSVDGAVRTWFRVAPDGTITDAFNDLPADDGKLVRQRFAFDGWWRDGDAVFPRHMAMSRNGQPYFTLDVESFDAE